MNYYDAQEIMRRHNAGEPINYGTYDEARACECGMRYGQHRVNDYRCPNQNWRPGNGQGQWLASVFKRTA